MSRAPASIGAPPVDAREADGEDRAGSADRRPSALAQGPEQRRMGFCGPRLFRTHHRRRVVFYRGVETAASSFLAMILFDFQYCRIRNGQSTAAPPLGATCLLPRLEKTPHPNSPPPLPSPLGEGKRGKG